MTDKLSPVLVEFSDAGPSIWCEGCGHFHTFFVEHFSPSGALWAWDGNKEKPTFSPSWHWKQSNGDVCHFFVKAGKIQYLADCTHKLAGQTLELAPLPDWL